MKKSKAPNGAGSLTPRAIDLDGPSSNILTPPPRRRTGTLVVTGVALVALLALFGLTLTNPDLFVSAVQAFVGNR